MVHKTRSSEIAHALLLPSIITAEDIGRLITPELTVKSISDSIPYNKSRNKRQRYNTSTKKMAILKQGITITLFSQAYSNLRANMPLTGGDAYQAAIAKYIQDNRSMKLGRKTIQFHPSYSYEDFVRGIVAKR